MTGVLDRAIATAESMEREGSDTIVTVRVSGMGKVPGVGDVPNSVASIRARARALAAAGVIPSSLETIRDVSMGEIERLTEVVSVREEGDGAVVDKVYRIRVNS